MFCSWNGGIFFVMGIDKVVEIIFNKVKDLENIFCTMIVF